MVQLAYCNTVISTVSWNITFETFVLPPFHKTHLGEIIIIKKTFVENCLFFGHYVSEVSEDASDSSNCAWSGFSRTAADNKLLSDSLSSLLWSSWEAFTIKVLQLSKITGLFLHSDCPCVRHIVSESKLLSVEVEAFGHPACLLFLPKEKLQRRAAAGLRQSKRLMCLLGKLRYIYSRVKRNPALWEWKTHICIKHCF